jgi:hypothetical protein
MENHPSWTGNGTPVKIVNFAPRAISHSMDRRDTQTYIGAIVVKISK